MILIGFLIKQQDIGTGIEGNDSEKAIVNNKNSGNSAGVFYYSCKTN